MPFLKLFGDAQERTVLLPDAPVVIGRGEDADVLVPDPKVSRRHCVVEPAGTGAWRVRDLGSGNGTSVNGASVAERELSPDDVIEIGDTKLLFAGRAAVPVAPDASPPPSRRIRRRGRVPVAAAVAAFAVAGAAAVFLLGRNGGGPAPAIAPPKVAERPAETPAPPPEAKPSRGAGAEGEARERQFAELQSFFDAYVEQGEYLLAYQLWFYLRGDWGTIPDAYRARIVAAMERLELAAAAERSRLFQAAAEAEAAGDPRAARELLAKASPRFSATAVAKSLEERIAALDRAVAETGRRGAPAPATVVRRDTARRVEELLALAARRDFAAAAAGLRALAAEAGAEAERAEIGARAEECEAAGALVAAAAEALATGRLPTPQLGSGKERWRVVAADAEGFVASSRGAERRFTWSDAPADLFIALLERHADGTPGRSLGLAVAAHFAGAGEAWLHALGRAYDASEAARPALDRFVAARVRKEPPPEGGYVVAGNELITRREQLRRAEEAAIARFRAQLDAALAELRGDRSLGKLGRLREKKEALDAARAHALELIFDEKRYFYPYRNVGRDAEYQEVQREVTRRVDAVRALWDDPQTVTVRPGPEAVRALERFDEAARELSARLVDVEEEAAEAAWLRGFFGRTFDVRSLYRTPEEKALLEYSAEVMADNEKVTGDITPLEREQVRVTNEYRMMLGRWPLRLVEPLVLSSRGHCRDMEKNGYFGHFSPTPGRRTPFDRMKLQGYEYGASENCIMGQTSPLGAHEGWCRSSGHHRNLLMPAWTEMGTGAHGIYMTQNFGQAPRRGRLFSAAEED
jgi:uncharacterized protein YkwD